MEVTLWLKGVFISFDNLLIHQLQHTWLLPAKFRYELPMWYTIRLYKSLKIFRLVFCRFLDLRGNLGTIDWPLKSDYSSLQNFVMNNPQLRIQLFKIEDDWIKHVAYCAIQNLGIMFVICPFVITFSKKKYII